MKKLIFFLLGAIIILSFGKKIKNIRDVNKTNDHPQAPATGVYGMVSTAHPLATKAGVGILKKGGNRPPFQNILCLGELLREHVCGNTGAITCPYRDGVCSWIISIGY